MLSSVDGHNQAQQISEKKLSLFTSNSTLERCVLLVSSFWYAVDSDLKRMMSAGWTV
jgi:hypothetical protein